MSFYREQKYLQEQPREVRQVKKSLPYTVTPIGDIKQWKAEQQAKQEKWDAGREQRYAVSRQRAIDVLEGKTPTHDANAEVEKAYNERQAALVKQACRPETIVPEVPKSFMQRMSEKILNFFLDLKL